MATKKKRTTKRQSISSGNPRSYGDMYKGDTTRQQPAATPTKATTPTVTAAAQSVDWRTEYSYVLRDLRTLLLVSAVLFAVIIIAGFFI
ncbi:MAG: hypothetical protein KDE47_28445 [Caldilineaceae bacterium]|nr:hypothetical protein [Caldilineaceae bacterium]